VATKFPARKFQILLDRVNQWKRGAIFFSKLTHFGAGKFHEKSVHCQVHSFHFTFTLVGNFKENFKSSSITTNFGIRRIQIFPKKIYGKAL